ncbi:MAG: YhdH/YhfP family quinone oxidoreductase [Candidatus Kapaibacterium sp.]
MKKFKALWVEEKNDGSFTRGISERSIDSLPQNDILIRVHYSSLNYKDALSARGHKGITRKYPFTPGIDAAGIVEEDRSGKFKPGQEVIVTGYDLGMNTSGGFGQYIRVPSEWAVKLPAGISLKKSMMYGTAGFTAGICIHEFLVHDITPDKGKILVTGATGGVGSCAVGMLSKIGFDVIASTGKDAADYLNGLGAKDIAGREDILDKKGRPILSARWSGVIDNVGGSTLADVIKSTDRRGIVCCLGNVAGDKFESYVYPFILRGIKLVGIDSAERPMELRLKIWDKIASNWGFNIENIIKEVSLEDLEPEIQKILEGGQKGRVLVNLKD